MSSRFRAAWRRTGPRMSGRSEANQRSIRTKLTSLVELATWMVRGRPAARRGHVSSGPWRRCPGARTSTTRL
eukprot:10704225-Alexandrium_andersonii.AAC.1